MSQVGSTLTLDLIIRLLTHILHQLEVIGLGTYGPAVLFIKLTIFLFFLRVFSPDPWSRRMIYFGIAMIVMFYTATTIALGSVCIPSHHKSWQEAGFASKCRDATIMGHIVGSFNVFSDFYIMLLPLPVIWKLQLPLRRKIGVSAIFLTGLL